MSFKDSTLQRAIKLTTGIRREDYGKPIDNMSRTAEIWTGILRASGSVGKDKFITPQDVALCMIGVKLAREANKHKEDNLDDIAGYVDVLEKVIKEGSCNGN